MLRRVVTLVCSLVLGAAAVFGFASGPLRHALREGSPGTYWVLAAGVVALAASVAHAWRNPPAHPAFGFACLALPQIAALASSVWTGRKLDIALDGLVGDVVPRIVSEGTSELLLPIVLANLFTVACAATIATSRVTHGSSDSRPPAKRVLLVGGAWIVASIVLFAISVRGHEVGLRALVPMLVVAMVVVAVTSRGEREPTLVAFAGVLAVFLLERAIVERARATAFGDLAKEATAPVEQARLLADYLDVRSGGRLALGVHVVLGVATSVSAHGLPRKSRAPLLAILVLIAAMSLREKRAFARRIEHARAAFDVGVPLPQTSVQSGWWVGGDRFIVNRAGAVTEVVPQSEIDEREEPGPRTVKGVLADADLGCGALVAALQPNVRRRQSFALAADRSAPNVPRPFVGELEPLVGGRQLVGLGFDLGHHFPIVESTLVNDALEVKLPGGETIVLALAIDPDDAARAVHARRPEPLAKRDAIQLTVHAADSVRRLAAALGILTAAFPMGGDHRYFALRVD